MSFLEKFWEKGKNAHGLATVGAEAAPGIICAPVAGMVIELEDFPDLVFAQGVLGPGCGVEPSGETIFSPITGQITQIAETNHAIGITSEDGVEVLIHVGVDTVDMNGKGFNSLVKVDQKVCAGQPLLQFSMTEIKAAGHPATVAVIVAGGEEGTVELFNRDDTIEAGKKLLKVRS